MQKNINIEPNITILDENDKLPSNQTQLNVDKLNDDNKALRNQSIDVLAKSKKIREGKAYAKEVRKTTQALLSGNYCPLNDGTYITGAEILAMNLFERSMNNDKSLALLLKTSGDISTKDDDNSSNSAEDVLTGAGFRF